VEQSFTSSGRTKQDYALYVVSTQPKIHILRSDAED
jgi:hypothetical protein